MTWNILAVLLAGLLLPASAAGPGIDAAWERLKSLAGEWQGVADAKKRTVTYTIVSGGNTIMESMTMPAPEPDMVTMYHRDGDALVATHYCSLGNQPRMRATEAPAGAKTIRFRFADITNLSKPDGPHIRHLTLTFQDADHFTQDWTSFIDGKEQPAIFKWSRVKK